MMNVLLRSRSKKDKPPRRRSGRIRKTAVQKKTDVKESPNDKLRKLSTLIQSWHSPLRFLNQPDEDGDVHPFVSSKNLLKEEEEYGSVIEPTFVPSVGKNLFSVAEESCRLVIDQIAETIEEQMCRGHNAKDAFEGACAPVISLNEYLFRLVKYMNKWFKEQIHIRSVGMRSLFLSLIYIKHLQEVLPDFELNRYNVHRLFLISMLIGAKFSEDRPISNKYWAKVGGVSKEQVNTMESLFCSMSEFNLYVTDAELETLYKKYRPPSIRL